MPISVSLIRKLEAVPKELREVLLDLVEELERQREEAITKAEFNELREAVTELAQEVRKLAEAQRKTEETVSRLEEAVERLAEAQRKTEERVSRLEEAVERLVEAQRKTEEEIRKLAQSHRRLREEVGGLSRSVAYALENEAFRHLPGFLRQRGIEVLERLIRTEIGGEEINLFARVRRDGEELLLVGEATLRLDDPSKLRQLKRKAALVETELGQKVFPVLVTHFAKKALLEKAEKAGVMVVQSFQW